MWTELKDTRNLEALLAKKSKNLVGADEPAVEKPKKPADKKSITRRLAWGIMILLIAGLVWLISYNAYNTAQLETLNSLTDTRLLAYESQIVTVKKLEKLFTVHDEASYLAAKTGINMSDELRQQYFPTEHYHGEVTQDEIVVEFQDIRYEITEADTVTFLVYLTRKTGTSHKQYILLAEYQGTKLVGFRTLI